MNASRTPNRETANRFAVKGMTLLELLLVMVLMGVVMGFGIGGFAAFDPGSGAAIETVRGALRSAVNKAKSERAPAVVRIDRTNSVVTPRGLGVVGTWHFEESAMQGAFGISGLSTGTNLAKGYLGAAVEFPAGINARVEFDIQKDPSFEFSEGFAIECLIAPEGGSSAHAISVGNVFGLYVLSTGAIRAWFVSADAEGESSGRVVLDSDPALLLPGQFTRVRIEYDRQRLMIWVEGVFVSELEASERVAPIQAPLLLGGGKKAFVGRIDELVLSAWEAGDPRPLPELVVFDANSTPEEIWFDAAGHLDSLRHPKPIELTIIHDDGKRQTARVGRWGTIE